MKLDVLGLLGACSYALDCVEAELVHVTYKHAKRVAYMSVCMAEQMGIQGKSLQDLTAVALLHDNALTQYIQEELHNDIASAIGSAIPLELGIHCAEGEKNMKDIPSHTDIKNVILYHHENADVCSSDLRMQMEVDLLEKNGQKYRFLHELSIYVICLTRSAAVILLIQTPGRR